MADAREVYANTGDGPQRVAVEAGDEGSILSGSRTFDSPYRAEPGERIEWVVPKGGSLYVADGEVEGLAASGPVANVEEVEARGPRG